ncbi:MAG: restriction endonuclease subunit S [Flavisolibacter sp.]
MSWKSYKIGDFLTRSKEPVKINPQDEYTLVTIRMYHKGVAKRSHVRGSTIKSPTLYKVRAGQFILSGIDARNRAFGIVPDELDGAIVTNDFWTHDIDTSIVDINFFYWFTTTPQFYEACIKASEGTTNRQRLQADKFYSFDVLLPSIDEQKGWVERISLIQHKYLQLEKELDRQQIYLQFLRQKILQEAVQGKLTVQDPTDESATELLKRIKAEKEKLIKAGKLKKEKELPPITEDEIPFGLPEGWVWCRLGEITNYGTSPKIETKNLSEETWILELEDIEPVSSRIIQKLRYRERKSLSTKNIFKKGDVLYSKLRPYLDKVVVADEDGVCSSEILPLRCYNDINPDFLRLRLKSPDFINYANSKVYGMNLPRLGSDDGRKSLFPLAPSAEQQRIIVKVQTLQQQLGKLEAQVLQNHQHLQQLLQTVLKETFISDGSPKPANQIKVLHTN